VQASADPPRAKRTQNAQSYNPLQLEQRQQGITISGSAIGRRETISMVAAIGSMLSAGNAPSLAVDAKEVGQYLPPYSKDSSLVLFVPGSRETPAIRYCFKHYRTRRLGALCIL
jgi:hypothetical protein